jgi:hypothetical protein
VNERSSHWQLQTIVSQLRTARDQWRAQNGRASGEQGGRELPSRAAMAEILEALVRCAVSDAPGAGGLARGERRLLRRSHS